MRVRAVGGTEAAGTCLVLSVLQHAERPPEGPWTADVGQRSVMDGAGAVWFVERRSVARVVALSCPCGCAELTTFRQGAEVERSVGPTR